MARIEGIRIQNFRCLKDVSLGELWDFPDSKPLTDMTVVIGKNGVGKSTLFDALGFLADALKYGVQEACDKRGGFEKIRSQGETGVIQFEITYRTNDSSLPMSYLIRIDNDDYDKPLIRTESLFQWTENGGRFYFLLLLAGVGAVLDDSKKDNLLEEGFDITITSETPEGFNIKVKGNAKLVDFIDRTKLGIASLGALKQHPEISEFRQFLESWYLSYFTPDAARSLPLDGVHQHLNSRGDNLANVVKYMEREYGDKFQEILDSIAEKIPGIHKISTQKTPDGRLLLCFNDKGFQDPFYAPQMSDGTLKLFAYLLLLADPNPPPFICIEEPENGLYHKLLEVLASEFRRHTSEENKTQLFITTHQPYFVDGLNPREVWILEKAEDGFSTIRRASDDELVNNLFEEEMPLGGLWYSGYLDKRAKPCTLKS